MTKKDFEKRAHKKSGQGAFDLLSMVFIVAIVSSAMSWIGLMNIKQNGGKLPWE